VRSLDARLGGKTFVVFVRQFKGTDGEPRFYAHFSADTKDVIAAVKDFKAKKGLGLDFNPERLKDCEASVKEAKLSEAQTKSLTFKQGDVLKMKPEDFKDVDVVTLYLLPSVNRELNDPNEVQPTSTHTSVTLKSPRRNNALASMGYQVLRFNTIQVREELVQVRGEEGLLRHRVQIAVQTVDHDHLCPVLHRALHLMSERAG